VGEWTTTAIGLGDGNTIRLLEELKYPHSLGLLYSAFTYFCGFKVNSGDYKFMGLAPYGHPIYYDLIKNNMIDVKEDGSYRLNLEYFDYYRGKTMINEEKFSELFGGGRRMPESKITQREMDIAASVQLITEEIIILLAKHAKLVAGSDIENLVIAGGVGLNCVANGKLQKSGIFKNIWIQPAAGDAGGSLGAALYVYYSYYNNQRHVEQPDSQQGSLLGCKSSMDEITAYLDLIKAPYHVVDDESKLYDKIADDLENDKIIGLAWGRMEFGPRALGNRSIIADCRSPYMQSRINLKIKYRESFRPFAPIVLEDRRTEYFDLPCDSPYMLKVGNVLEHRRKPFDIDKLMDENKGDMLKVISQPRSDIPAVTHVDYSARIQTVDEYRNPRLYKLMKAYEKRTGCAVLVNTSFNVRGEPIVCSPKDAYECFMRTDMDVLVLENAILYKEEQPEFQDKVDWREKYALD
jgi:carbamoyltransferase